MRKKILFLVPYPPGESPSQRFRFEQYFTILTEHHIGYRIQSFLDSDNWRLFFKPGNFMGKTMALLKGFMKRSAILFQASGYDFVFIHREVTPVGPPVFEWIIARLLKKKIIYDFDDAIWLTDRPAESWALRVAKWRSKVGSICRWAHKVSCGNEYLRSYASAFSSNAVYIPTTIDTEHWHNPDRVGKKSLDDPDRVVVGWTGSHSTLKYLNDIQPILQKLESQHQHVQILIIADKKPDLALRSLQFIPWNSETEVNDLMAIDIGIMPLPDNEWAKGKCGFKALQYMALRIPAIVSPVGVNPVIVDHTLNGFLADTPEAWLDSLSLLISNTALRRKMGDEGRRKVIDNYSVSSNSSAFLSLFA